MRRVVARERGVRAYDLPEFLLPGEEGEAAPTTAGVERLACCGFRCPGGLDAAAAAPILKAITSATGFGADLDHLSVHGLCAACRAAQGV